MEKKKNPEIVRVSISCRVLRTCKGQSPVNIQQALTITIINFKPHLSPSGDLLKTPKPRLCSSIKSQPLVLGQRHQ